MKPISVSRVITIVIACLFFTFSQAQTIGISSSAVWMSDCNQNNYFNTTGLIGPAGNTFSNTNFGTHTKNSGSLILRGAEIRTFKTPGASNVCNAHLYYRIYMQGGVPGTFNSVDLALADDCNVSTNQFAFGESCAAGDQKWKLIIADGTFTPYAPVDLTTMAPGNYVLEVYYDIIGSTTSTSLCDETIVSNNGGLNYKASFTIQAPLLASANPTTCNGSEGFITISGLTSGAMYAISYLDDGSAVGPNNIVADATGQIIIDGLNAGVYSDFELGINGCITNLNTGVILSNPVIIARFNKIAAFCEGTTAPSLPATSLNGLSGTWNPSVINSTTSGSYTFTPNPNQCGIPVTINVTVTPKATPIFAFGTSVTICSGDNVPVLPSNSNNGITGTWSPSIVSNTASAIYTFTPSNGQCANGTSFSVTVNSNKAPTFGFGSALTICAGSAVPALRTTSDNGITGTWSSSTIDNQNSAIYTFTPSPGQCATTTTFDVTVNPIVAPVFSFGLSLTICSGDNVTALPVTSLNGITGTWNPSIIDNKNSNTYIFTPVAGECGTTTSLQVTVKPIIIPAFSFGSSLTVCPGTPVPALPSTSENGISGTWSPSTIDNQTSGVYTFTPTSGPCASTVSIIVTVSPMIIPVFNFGTASSICAGSGVPTLSNTSQNGITGTWNPATVDNQNSNTYTFTPDSGQCAVGSSFTVTVDPNVVPIFDFGTSLIICAGSPFPSLPQTSQNGVFGVWSPATINDQASGVYTFTPATGQCGTSTSLTVTVNQNTIPTFSFGTSLVICAGANVPTLPAISANGIAGTWSPAIVNNQTSGVYTFTPELIPGQCLSSTNYIVTVNQNSIPNFSFGTTLNICAGSAPPLLPTTSTNAITGTWSLSVINNQTSGTYTFTPNTGQCASSNLVLTVNVTPVGTVDFESDTSVTDGTIISGNSFYGTPSGVSFMWTNSNTSIGLAASGTGNVPTFTAINKGSSLNKATIVMTPVYNGCAGAAKSYVITVIPLAKDIFVPNVFSPNGDGKNDILYAYSNYIEKMEMQIFNQWGQLVQVITDKQEGWDGKYKGAPQPVGVYMYIVKATMTDGRTINLKGSTTLLR